MNFSENVKLNIIFSALFEPYRERVPNVSKITNAMVTNGMIASENDIVNDHVAFRTLGVPHLGIQSFEKIFLHYGFKKMEHYYFESKKIDAFWYAPPHPSYPRIFVSELRVADLSFEAQEIIKFYIKDIDSDPVDSLDLDNAEEVGAFFHTPLWRLPTFAHYNTLANESEYAAWVIYNRYYLNHYTISVHELDEPNNKLENFNDFLNTIGVKLNDAGGVIKTSGDGFLRQSSSVAEMVKAKFADGIETMIPGSYVEFAERSILPQFTQIPLAKISREHRREGFETSNADKIFESTFKSQTSK
jgi:hypothetical protein